MGPLLWVLLACDAQVGGADLGEPAAADVAQAEVDPLVGLHKGIDAARARLRAGDRAGAAAQVRQAYQVSFTALEPLLRAHDPQACLELEYAFGLLAADVERSRSGSDLGADAKVLLDRVDTAVAAARAAAEAPPPG